MRIQDALNMVRQIQDMKADRDKWKRQCDALTLTTNAAEWAIKRAEAEALAKSQEARMSTQNRKIVELRDRLDDLSQTIEDQSEVITALRVDNAYMEGIIRKLTDERNAAIGEAHSGGVHATLYRLKLQEAASSLISRDKEIARLKERIEIIAQTMSKSAEQKKEVPACKWQYRLSWKAQNGGAFDCMRSCGAGMILACRHPDRPILCHDYEEDR